ncbi:sigma-70 family RNA polymerase sigma factor [Candidatus Falkowbacteria bacterium]|nr:sigma-70 family RNA polymerase sigma factor [Candidatus Falkowbacteria bacterium]
MKEIRVEARLRNNILYHAIFDRFKSVASFCRKYKLCQSSVGGLLNLKRSPLARNKSYSVTCEKIAKIFRMTPDMLFPPALYKIKQPERIWEISFSQLPSMSELKQLSAPSDPEKDIIEEEFKQSLAEALSLLAPREEQVLKYLYGLDGYEEKSLQEVGEIFHVSHTRIGQIRDKALRKLRHPTRIKLLRAHIY